MRIMLDNIGQTSVIQNLSLDTPHSHVHSTVNYSSTLTSECLPADQFSATQNTTAKYITIRTSGSPIIGSFKTDEHTVLSTTGSMINVDLHLSNRGALATRASLWTLDAPLNATIHMASTDGEQGTFCVSGFTPYVLVTFPWETSPRIVNLSSHFTFTNAVAHVGLPHTFEGTIDGRTSSHDPDIDYTGDIEDPAGGGRRRTFEYELSKVTNKNRWAPVHIEV